MNGKCSLDEKELKCIGFSLKSADEKTILSASENLTT